MIWKYGTRLAGAILPVSLYRQGTALARGGPYGVAVAVAVGEAVEVAVGVKVGVAVNVAVGGTTVVGGTPVNVAVGGWELCRVMRGLIHSAKSSWEEPFARTDRMNLTLSPFRVLRSMLRG